MPIVLFVSAIAPLKKKEKEKEKTPLEKLSINGLKFRCVGPALTAGRISDIAVNPNNNSEYCSSNLI